MCVGGAVVGAEDAGVAVLGLGGVNAQAANLPVRAVHHLHELTAPTGDRGKPPLPPPDLTENAGGKQEVLLYQSKFKHMASLKSC